MPKQIVGLASCWIVTWLLLAPTMVRAEDTTKEAEMAGYLLVPHGKVAENYNAGFSMYVTAWPLLQKYPGNRFQTGLFGTWMFAQYDGPEPPRKMYSDIEGGLGWWRDTRFATETPKFIMGGVALNFSEWTNGPGAGKGRDWEQPKGKYGIAQLSPWILWPPDGLNLKPGTCNELFGYGYLTLPLTQSKSTTAGKNVPTGDNCWTLFLNTGNFKGPVAFFTPFFWSQATTEDTSLSGLFLDSRPANPNKSIQMETQYVPAYEALDAKGITYARIAPTSFPRDASGDTLVVHRVTAYDKHALWDSVKTWFEDGTSSSGRIDASASAVHTFDKKGTPSDAASCWQTPGPVAGPFESPLGDGSVVTYYWYRFADQPAILNADLSAAERELLQLRVEKLHRHWTKDREYLPPPTVGKLADLDDAVIVTPPPGLEVGYVPIVTRQAPFR